MDSYKEVYQNQPEQYDALVRAEDRTGALIAALREIRTIQGATIVEVGAGTGRITRQLLHAGAGHVVATELEDSMLELARKGLVDQSDRVQFLVADARSLPLDADIADMSIAGWVFGHFRSWLPDSWKSSTGKALSEMQRVTRSGGQMVIIETLGTGSEEPLAPNAGLEEYYGWLEVEHGFQRQEIRTDYEFGSVAEAARVTGIFFGEVFAARVEAEGWCQIPECTGIWSKTLP